MKPHAILAAAILSGLAQACFAKPLQVFILAGQSNVVGQGEINPLGTAGTIIVNTTRDAAT